VNGDRALNAAWDLAWDLWWQAAAAPAAWAAGLFLPAYDPPESGTGVPSTHLGRLGDRTPSPVRPVTS
jgi:hypothetical protein